LILLGCQPKTTPNLEKASNPELTLSNTLLEHDLIDESSLIVVPIFIGLGKRLLEQRYQPLKLKLLEKRTYANGVLRLKYVPDRG
jgi:dihydrofolate reductase